MLKRFSEAESALEDALLTMNITAWLQQSMCGGANEKWAQSTEI
ncbi:hypothetical protein D515_04532 [Grimontia indica]|uniref:Uncharacterized protein n=1 Tax=Grimontia indica TaxID=1056512 RepID=R1IIA7_9GAMM|nr:hypothetical protein D515_04532 [Grimontia indica]